MANVWRWRTWLFLILFIGGSPAARPILSSHTTTQLDVAPAKRFYTVMRTDGIWWLRTPEGKPFYSLGVDVVDRGPTLGAYDMANPAYAAFRYYPDDAAWARHTMARLRTWNFNTLGGWSDVETIRQARQLRMPYTPVLHLGSQLGVPWIDLFAPEFPRQLDELAQVQVAPFKDDPQLLGWFTDNELGWWEDTLFIYFLNQPETNATRKALLNVLKAQYGGEFTRLQADFNTGSARTFDELKKVTLKPGGGGRTAVRRFGEALAERYYSAVSGAIRKADPNHLVMGDRYANHYPFSLARAAGRHLDVISTNHSCPGWDDGEIAHFFLESLHRLTGKPLMITEYYFSAMDNRSGNLNPGGIFPTVSTQGERTRGFSASLRAFLNRPYLVGAHWFQYYDEPVLGRSDGENYNMGLVDIQNRPYGGLTQAARRIQNRARSLHRDSYRYQWKTSPHPGGVSIPPAPPTPMEGLAHWNKTRGLIPTVGPPPYADIYASWSPQKLYLAVYTSAYIDKGLYENDVIPEWERMMLEVRVNGNAEPIRVRFGPGGPTEVTGGTLEHRTRSDGLRTTVLLALPSHAFGLHQFSPQGHVKLSATLRHPLHSEPMTWETSLRFSASGRPPMRPRSANVDPMLTHGMNLGLSPLTVLSY